MSPPTPFEGLEQINWATDRRNVDRISKQLPNNDIRPNTNWTSQPPTLTRVWKTYHKKYLVKRGKKSNMDNNFGYDLDLSENIPEQLKKRARPEKRPKHGREGSHCGSSDCAVPCPPLIESRYLNHLRL